MVGSILITCLMVRLMQPENVRPIKYTISDFDLFECNEALRLSCCLGRKCMRCQGKINVNGGAIALGHPVGCTGLA